MKFLEYLERNRNVLEPDFQFERDLPIPVAVLGFQYPDLLLHPGGKVKSSGVVTDNAFIHSSAIREQCRRAFEAAREQWCYLQAQDMVASIRDVGFQENPIRRFFHSPSPEAVRKAHLGALELDARVPHEKLVVDATQGTDKRRVQEARPKANAKATAPQPTPVGGSGVGDGAPASRADLAALTREVRRIADGAGAFDPLEKQIAEWLKKKDEKGYAALLRALDRPGTWVTSQCDPSVVRRAWKQLHAEFPDAKGRFHTRDRGKDCVVMYTVPMVRPFNS